MLSSHLAATRFVNAIVASLIKILQSDLRLNPFNLSVFLTSTHYSPPPHPRRHTKATAIYHHHRPQIFYRFSLPLRAAKPARASTYSEPRSLLSPFSECRRQKEKKRKTAEFWSQGLVLWSAYYQFSIFWRMFTFVSEARIIRPTDASEMNNLGEVVFVKRSEDKVLLVGLLMSG